MRDSHGTHHIIYGAGAVGGTLGLLLRRSGRRVTLIGRPALVQAVDTQGGVRFIADGREELVPIEVRADALEVRLDGPPRLHFTMKAGDLAPALPRARDVFGPDAAVVTWQNGIRAEEIAHAVFSDLIAGIVRATSTMLSPGTIRIRTPGIMIVGRYPPRPDAPEDDALLALRDELRAAGYDTVTSPDIRSDKALKLLVNLFSGASPLVRLDGSPTPELTRIERNVVIEGAHILAAAGIPFAALSGRGDDVPTILRHLAERKPGPPVGDGVHNSTWQNLSIPGRRLENDYTNGEIVTRARELGESAPWNERLLRLLTETRAAGLGPGALSDTDFGARFKDLADPPPFSAAPAGAFPPE